MEGWFDVVVAGDDCPQPKPAPDMILRALSELGVSAENALMVGDSRKERMKNVIDMLNVNIIDAASDPLCTPGCFMNVNTPEDLARAEGQTA